MPNQKTMWTRCPGGFSVMWVTKLLISPVKKRIFCPKTTKFGPKLAFLVILGQALPAHWVPCWWVGGCGARAVSRKTPIYFITFEKQSMIKRLSNPINRDRSAANISKVMCSNTYIHNQLPLIDSAHPTGWAEWKTIHKCLALAQHMGPENIFSQQKKAKFCLSQVSEFDVRIQKILILKSGP